MAQTIEACGQQLQQQGILASAVEITSVPRAEVLNSDVAARKYNGFGFNVQIADDIDTINAKIDLTL